MQDLYSKVCFDLKCDTIVIVFQDSIKIWKSWFNHTSLKMFLVTD